MKRSIFVIWAIVLILSLTLAACSPGSGSTSQQEGGGGQPVVSTQGSQPGSGEEQPGPQPTQQQVVTGEAGARDDIPVMDGAREYQVMRGGASIVYEIDADIDTVVNFYQEQLPQYGWEMAGPPDSALASIATMLRENGSGDRMTINMQENQVGGFVKVNISVVRKN
jgi:hypothetical protein